MNADKQQPQPRLNQLENASVTWLGGPSHVAARISNLGAGGIFIKTADPLPVGSNLTLILHVADRDCHIRGVVRRSIPAEGMGIQFTSVDPEDQAVLNQTTESSSELSWRVQESAPSTNVAAIGGNEPHPLKRVPDPSDRRSYRRHDVRADVEVTDEESRISIQSQLAGLNHGGCYLKTENPLNVGGLLAIKIAKGAHTFQSRARVVCHNPREGMGVMFCDTAPEQLLVLRGWLDESLEKLWWTTERRKNQRVLMQVPVRITGQAASDPFIEETQTRKIGADGCSVFLSRQVSRAQHLMLQNCQTKAVTECIVAHITNLPGGRYEVAMAFMLPHKQFWPVFFPPSEGSTKMLATVAAP